VIQSIITKLVNRESLSQNEAAAAMEEIMTGMATESQISAFLIGLRMKGETPEEIAGCASVMRSKAVKISSRHEILLDTCGTGGDQSGTFNISTAAAIVAAGSGVPVAKHGNRAVSSKSGSADVLRALGVNLDITPEKAGRILDQVGITFLFAPHMHQAMKYAVNVRKELAIRTIFNILGPLTNPAGALFQVLGVYASELTETMAHVLCRLGSRRALVVHGEGGIDEISTLGPTFVSEVRDSSVTSYRITPQEVGLATAKRADILGGDAQRNAEIIRSILDGKRGPHRDIVVFNAGAGLYVAGAASTLIEGVKAAEHSVDTGNALRTLNRWSDASRSDA